MPETLTPETPVTDVSELLLRADVQKALSEIIEVLPKLAPVLALAGKGVDVAREVITDADVMGGIEEIVKEKARPVQQKVQDVMGAVKEASRRAEQSNQTIGVFGLLKILKDPNVQYGLRFVQALADVASERGLINTK